MEAFGANEIEAAWERYRVLAGIREEAHRRARILESLPKLPAAWEDYREVISASELWDPIRWPGNHDWFLVKNVPLNAFREVSIDAIAAVDDREERREHRERYKAILKMLKQHAAPWPVIVADTGMIIDGYHRLAALRTLKQKSVDVLYVIV